MTRRRACVVPCARPPGPRACAPQVGSAVGGVFGCAVVTTLVTALIVLLVTTSCGIVALRPTPGPPRRFVYVDPHGRPRAWGGGVCPLRGRHEHAWPPTPPSAFVDDDGAWRDTRAIVSFDGPHDLDGHRCNTTGWHQHALAPTTKTTAMTPTPSSR